MIAAEPRQTLTDKQREIYCFIIRYWGENYGTYPTIRTVAKQFGISSPNGVVCHYKALAKKGYIELLSVPSDSDEPSQSRNIRVIELRESARELASLVLADVEANS